jgi:cell division protein FtsI/penicillin-binding protein 2
MSIGQEVSVTALQMVAAFGAIANGGTLMQPRLVRSVFDAAGKEIRRFEPKPVRQVVSTDTARTLTRLMIQVVAAGTGHNAAIPGHEVAGKTGTAQKLDPARGVIRGSYVLVRGFAPPRAQVMMLVVLDEPKNEKSDAAAPIFSAIGAGAAPRRRPATPRRCRSDGPRRSRRREERILMPRLAWPRAVGQRGAAEPPLRRASCRICTVGRCARR